MHLKRNQAIKGLPLTAKGTKYVARASNSHKKGVPLVIALRDMLGIVRNAKEARHLVNQRIIKINGKEVKEIREPILPLNILEAGEFYKLVILPTGRFKFEKTNVKTRVAKIINKKSLSKNKTQLNLFDGTNIIYDQKGKIKVGDSVELNLDNKVKSIKPLEKGKKATVTSGRSIGLTGIIKEVKENKALIFFEEKDKEVELDTSHIVAI